jgi:hypothetical protein
VPHGVPIGGPLPDVADHVVNAVSVWRERLYGRWARIAILCSVLSWEFTLPSVGHVLSARRELIAPSIFSIFESTPRGKFPFYLSRQFLARPSRVGNRIRINDMHYRMVIEIVDGAFWTVWVSPIRPF